MGTPTTYFVYGARGVGKTHNAALIAAHLTGNPDRVVDDWEPGKPIKEGYVHLGTFFAAHVEARDNQKVLSFRSVMAEVTKPEKRKITMRKIDGQVVLTIPDQAVPGVANLLTIASGALMDSSVTEPLIHRKVKYEKAANEAVGLSTKLMALVTTGDAEAIEDGET